MLDCMVSIDIPNSNNHLFVFETVQFIIVHLPSQLRNYQNIVAFSFWVSNYQAGKYVVWSKLPITRILYLAPS